MTTTKWWLRSGLLIAGVPALTGCSSTSGNYQCPPNTEVAWAGQLTDGGRYDGGHIEYAECRVACGVVGACACSIVDAGVLTCSVCCGGGRAPPGLLALSAVDGSAGSWLARMAELEAAAVPAFAQLADELDAHHLEGYAHHARQAALEEVSHARAVTRLALGFGHCPGALRLAPSDEVRSLEEIAVDNASEGCGRELFGAVLNRWQGMHAADARVRAVMGSIADDEHSHARYSFALAEALSSRLSVAQRRRTKEAQERMLSRLAHEDSPGSTRQLLGLMDIEQVASTARALLENHRL